MKKFISSIIALAMVLSMLPMTMASAADATALQLVSLDKPASVYIDGKLSGSSAKLTDGGSATGIIDYVNSSGDKVTYIDLEASYAISKVVVDRSSGYGATTTLFEMYASDTLYETITAVKANAALIGTHEGTEKGTDVTFTPATAIQGQYVYLVATTPQSIFEITVYADTVIKNAIEQVVSLKKPAKAYSDSGAEKTSKQALITDGNANNQVDWISTKVNAIKIDLGKSQAISKLDIVRHTQFGEKNNALTFYVSDNDYTTSAEVKTKAIPIATTSAATNSGKNEETVTVATPVIGRYVYAVDDQKNYQRINEITVYAKTTREAAAISATEATSIEFETYVPEFADAYGVTPIESSSWNITQGDGAADNIYVHTATNHIGNDKAVYLRSVSQAETKTINIPVKITGDGWYAVDAQLGATGGPSGFSPVTMKLVDSEGNATKLLDTDYQNSEVADYAGMRRVSPANGHYTYGFSGVTNFIKEGNYTLETSIQGATANVFLDYLKLTPVTPTAVKTNAPTTIELEALDIQYANGIYQGTSGGRALYSTYGSAKSGKANVYNIPVNVEKVGRYDLSTVMNKRPEDSFSKVTVAVNGAKIYDNTTDGELMSEMQGGYIDKDGNLVSNYAVHKYTGTVDLPAGESVITVTVESKFNLHRFMADCITIEKAAARTEYTIQPYAASNIATAASWFTDIARTTPATTALSSIVSAYKPPSGVIGSYSCDSFGKKGFSDNYLSVRGVYAGTTANSDNEAVTFTLNDTLVIDATDYYKLSYAFGGVVGYGFSGMSLELVDVNDATKKNVITRYVPEDWSNKDQNGHGALSNQSVYTNDHNEIAKIDAGEYKVNITIHSPQDTKSGHYFSLSDINLKATDPVEVTATAKTVLEYEDYTHYGDYQNTTEAGVANASGGKAAITYYGTPFENGPIEINMPITVTEGTDYKIEAALARGYCGATKVYVDGEEILYNHDLTYPMGVSLLNDNNYAMYKGSKVVNLTAGEHMITTKVTKAGNLLRMGADYISIEKYYENPISQSEATRIEAEDYADEFAAAFGETAYEDGLGNYKNPTQPVGKVKFTGSTTGEPFSGNYAMMGSKATEGEKTFSIPVTVTEEGYYNATFRVGGTITNSTFAWFDAVLVAEDGTEYVLSDGIIRPVMSTGTEPNTKPDNEAIETQVRINDGQGRYSWQLTGSSVNVPAGEYNLKFTLDGTTFLLDYVEINPVAVAAVGDKIEVDDVNIRRVAYDESLASGGTIQYAHWAHEDDEQIKLVYPIKIDEAGYYDVETVMFYSEGDNTSRTKVMIDDKVIYDNRNAATDLSTFNEEGNRIFVNGYFPMNKYTGGKVYLEEGVHEIVYVINATQEDAKYVYKFAYDYTKVTKSQDSIDVAGDGYVTITANYTEPVTGTVFMAFYNDGALVSVEKSKDANNETVVNGEAQGPTTDYDYVKMFVWDIENDNIAPDAFAIGFNN